MHMLIRLSADAYREALAWLAAAWMPPMACGAVAIPVPTLAGALDHARSIAHTVQVQDGLPTWEPPTPPYAPEHGAIPCGLAFDGPGAIVPLQTARGLCLSCFSGPDDDDTCPDCTNVQT